MGITQAYEFLVDFGQRIQEQQDNATPAQEPGTQIPQDATPTTGQGEVVQNPSPDATLTAEEWAALAAMRQSEVSSTGQPGQREVSTPEEAVEMSLEQLYT